MSEEISRLVDAVDALHGFVEKGGLAHAVGVDNQVTADAIAGHRLAANDEIANAITQAKELRRPQTNAATTRWMSLRGSTTTA